MTSKPKRLQDPTISCERERQAGGVAEKLLAIGRLWAFFNRAEPIATDNAGRG